MKWGEDPHKWVIDKIADTWRVSPPIRSFWGVYTFHPTGDEALADFRRQTAPPQGDR